MKRTRALGWIVIALALLAGVLIGAATARAQFTPVQDYTSGPGCPTNGGTDVTQCAGYQVRQDINNHLSGISPISPSIVSLPFASLPSEQDGQLYYCHDCAQAIPCAGGGTGAWALGTRGVWACTSPGGGGSGSGVSNPMTTALNGGGYSVTNVGLLSLESNSAAVMPLPILDLDNINPSAQTAMEFSLSGGFLSALRGDYQGNLNLESGLSGGISFWTGAAATNGGALVANLNSSAFTLYVPALVPSLSDSALTVGNCVQAGASGLLTTTSGPCGTGGGGGSGTVSSGTGPAIAQYASGTGTVVNPVTFSGDCTIAQGGALTCTKTSGAAFAASATTDTTDAANLSSGTLSTARLPAAALQDVTPAAVTISGATTLALPADGHSLQTLTLAATATITIPQGQWAGQHLEIIQCENSTGGFTPTYSAAGGLTLRGTFPAPTTTASKCDVIGISYPTTTTAFLMGYNLNE